MKQRVKYPSPGKLPASVKPFVSVIVEKDIEDDEITVIATFSCLGENANATFSCLEENEKYAFGLAFGGHMLCGAKIINIFGDGQCYIDSVVKSILKALLNDLANYSVTGEVELAYWGVGRKGKVIDEVGSISVEKIDSIKMIPSENGGACPYLVPIMKYFIEDKLKDAPRAMAIIITNSPIVDLEDVKKYTEQLAVAAHNASKYPIKLVLIGLGEHVDAGQLSELYDFETSVGIDVWTSKLASEMEELHEVFDEVMSENLIIAPSGKVLDNKGKVLATFNDGLPARIEFKLNSTSNGFKLEVPGQLPIEQDLSEALALL